MPSVILRPNAAGDLTNIPSQFPAASSHWDKVDEVVADDDVTYVFSTVRSLDTDLYNLPAYTGGSVIKYIDVYAVLKEETAGGQFQIICKTHGTVYGGGYGALTNDYVLRVHHWALNPFTLAAWTVAEIDDLQIGIELYPALGGGAYVRCTQMYVDITYAQAGYNISSKMVDMGAI
jgi:hypothetical protein